MREKIREPYFEKLSLKSSLKKVYIETISRQSIIFEIVALICKIKELLAKLIIKIDCFNKNVKKQ